MFLCSGVFVVIINSSTVYSGGKFQQLNCLTCPANSPKPKSYIKY